MDRVAIRRERQLADYLMVPSDMVREEVLRDGVPADRVVLMPYGVDEEMFATPNRHHAGSTVKALFVGNDAERKGLRELLQGTQVLRATGQLHLTIVGAIDPSAYSEVGTSGVVWAGGVPKFAVAEFFKDADVFVLPTSREGSALVVYEAMAAGLCVLTTDRAGSVIRDGHDGIVITDRTADSVGTQMARLCQNPGLIHRLGAEAVRTISANFTWAAYGQRVIDTYRECFGLWRGAREAS